MAEFTFNCSECGQHLTAEKDWQGLAVECPSCKNQIIVPYLACKTLLDNFTSDYPNSNSKFSKPHSHTNDIDSDLSLHDNLWTKLKHFFLLFSGRVLFKIVAVCLIVSLAFIWYSKFSASAKHKQRLKKLNGYVAFNELQWENPSDNINVDTRDKNGLIVYRSNKHSFQQNIKSKYDVTISPVFEQSPDGTRTLRISFFSNTQLGDKCHIAFSSGAKRDYSVKYFEKYKGTDLHWYSIFIEPEEYYLYFVKDTPKIINIEMFDGFMMSEYNLSGRKHEFLCFRDMGELFKIQSSPRESKEFHRKYEEYFLVECYLFDNYNNKIIPCCNVELMECRPEFEKAFAEYKKISGRNKDIAQREQMIEFSAKNFSGTSQMQSDRLKANLNDSMKNTYALLDFMTALKKTKTLYKATSRTGQLKWIKLPKGEYTLYATVDHGPQRLEWVKRITVSRGRTKIVLTNDDSCYISQSKH